MSPRFQLTTLIVLLGVAWTIYFLGRQSAINQFEIIYEDMQREHKKRLPTPSEIQSASKTEGFLNEPPVVNELGNRIAQQLHKAAAKRFFQIAGINVDNIRSDLYYEVDAPSDKWLVLSGEADDRKAATLIAAAKVSSPEQLAELVEQRWKIPRKNWKRLSGITIDKCECEAYEIQSDKETFAMIIGKGESSDLVHAVAEMTEAKNVKATAKDLAQRIHFSKSENF